MKLLKVIANGFKNCEDGFEISFVPVARKSSQDKEYELQEIAEGLYAFSTMAVVGKNASGKTSALELLDLCYDILSDYRVDAKNYSLENVFVRMYFYHEGFIYRYSTTLKDDPLKERVFFDNQQLLRKQYFKSKIKELFDFDISEAVSFDGDLPEDTSCLFFALKKIQLPAMFYNSFDLGPKAYRAVFSAHRVFNLSEEVIAKIIHIFDENITSLEMIDETHYRLSFCGKEEILSDNELYYRISSGTTKGLALYVLVVLSLQNGFDLIIDEIENHFHKSLVENIISLYKDKSINRKNATLVFATHYCELLDLFTRQDNIFITRADDKVKIYNMYVSFDVRTDLLKSKMFYNNAFKTAVNYDALMALKKELKK